MVAPAKGLAYVWQTEMGQFLCQGHCDLARARDITAAFLGIHLRDFDLVIISDGLLDIIDRDLAALQGKQVFEVEDNRIQSGGLVGFGAMTYSKLPATLQIDEVNAGIP